MRDYEGLVKSLRICADSADPISECCFSDCCEHDEPIDPLCMGQLIHMAADAIEELSKSRWIPVAEALPENECPVLVTYLGFHDRSPRANMLAYIDRDLGWCWWDDDIPGGVPCSVEITHWMPLPEPPKEE